MIDNVAVLTPQTSDRVGRSWRSLVTATLQVVPFLALFFVSCAAAYGSFFAKWGFCSTGVDPDAPCLLQEMLDGTAKRPWIYRRLVPELAQWLQVHTPAGLQARLESMLQADNMAQHYSAVIAAVNQPAALQITFYYVYLLGFVAFVGAAVVMWRIGMQLTADRFASALAATVFVLVFPMFLTVGGNFYDFSELFFYAMAFWLALCFSPGWLVLLAPLATYNKEAFFFFSVTLFPLLANRFGWRKGGLWTLLVLLVSGITYSVVKTHYAGNPGGVVQFHLWDQLHYFRYPGHLKGFEFQYGLVTPKSFNLINILLVVMLVRTGWLPLPRQVKQYLWLALAVNVPLFLLFCYPGEIRNLSMLYMGLVSMLACGLSYTMTRFYQGRVTDDAGTPR
ncbi:hypothetical protein [Silvimonas amylolytica]|uniref:Uncharacterized protein n=1 Tax=Silvimonas amylolytica TaxID=449663 RepID=A0ABQ2PML0_9NEIS|nr:hypothetical protein [Silvimonas amylolytica]GGP26451.1 hypothetical protein GCM10010971_22700 [Silvimonas amylolytica]